MSSEKQIARMEALLGSLLQKAGIELNGASPWDIQVHDERFFQRFFSGGSLALGESYMDGWWDVESLDDFFVRVFQSGIDRSAHRYAFTGPGLRMGQLAEICGSKISG